MQDLLNASILEGSLLRARQHHNVVHDRAATILMAVTAGQCCVRRGSGNRRWRSRRIAQGSDSAGSAELQISDGGLELAIGLTEVSNPDQNITCWLTGIDGYLG